METFAEIYCNQSPTTIFKHADTLFVLAYSTIMLNTDLHNPQVKTKMTLEQFIGNNKGINQGEDLPVDFLTELYNSILEVEIKMEGDEAYPNALKKGSLTLEQKTNLISKSKRTRRWFVLDENLVLHQFKSTKEEGSAPISSMSLKEGVTVERRVDDDAEKKKELVFTLYQTITPDDTVQSVISGALRLIAPSQRVFDEWIKVLETHARCIVTSVPPTIGLGVEEYDQQVTEHYLN